MKNKAILKDNKGATVVEFAIIIPIVLIFIFGIIEFSLLLYNKQVITNACREGAREGIVIRSPTRLSNADIEKVIKDYAGGSLITFGSDIFDEGDIDILPDEPRQGNLFGTDLSVEIKYKYEFLFLSNFGIGPVDLVAKTIMKFE
ncbi:MAG: pilus assembly protein [Deltaproteobacteria bacterium]|nr:pilus assembly protein [Deltaproteobacteria bacterium]MBW2642607.1 pilus assembly protein [Deltaproteobacteria bacterium]